MRFWKGHALGNDYIVVDGTDAGAPGPGAVRGLCDRHRGVGGDGLLVADLAVAPAALRIFNPDGSEAEKSGNGLRIFGAWLHDQGHVSGDAFEVALPGTSVRMLVLDADDDGTRTDARAGTRTLRVDMGRPSFRAGDVGFTGAAGAGEDPVEGRELDLGDVRLRVHLVSMGNPHCVIFGDDLDAEWFRRIAPRVQTLAAFQRGVNVQLARPAGTAAVEALVWERGAGETLASGSSACAVAAAARRSGRIDAEEVEVRMEGGTVGVWFDAEGRAHLTGPARIVYSGVVPDAVIQDWSTG